MRNLALAAGIFATSLWLGLTPLSAIPEYTEKEKKECAFCHPNGDLFALNDAGVYYAEHGHSLEGYEEAAPAKPAPPKPEPAKPKPAPPEPAKPAPGK
jgi:hypothetical protein